MMTPCLQLQLILGLCLALTTTGLVIYTGSNEEDRLVRQAQAQHAQAIETGAALFATHCRACHGLNGEGVGQLGPPLNDAHFFTDRLAEVGWPGTLGAYIAATISSGRVTATRPLYAGDGGIAVMSAWSNRFGGPLRDDQINDLAAFILNWQPTALGQVELTEITLPPPNPANHPETIRRGQAVFLSAGCADCHPIDGVGQGEGGPDLSHIGTTAADRNPELSAENYIRESFLIPNAYFVPGFEPETAGVNCGGILSEPQLDDLVSFLVSRE
jgi:mono/diheme cytochrome c family protein